MLAERQCSITGYKTLGATMRNENVYTNGVACVWDVGCEAK